MEELKKATFLRIDKLYRQYHQQLRLLLSSGTPLHKSLPELMVEEEDLHNRSFHLVCHTPPTVRKHQIILL
ncbi:hypothetical protein AXF15_00460 [Desulfomicrobium orale DSM 12838]|uniref:Uncharacterized protein n=1 Tax=Desulfomicrobium orale DSM 12838 TaxID=888061 RepID=A0A0X8JN10_9BACT|nr:hypothetical protein AXF15_00460 [Desulfomicrobium orale DSM 12838]